MARKKGNLLLSLFTIAAAALAYSSVQADILHHPIEPVGQTTILIGVHDIRDLLPPEQCPGPTISCQSDGCCDTCARAYYANCSFDWLVSTGLNNNNENLIEEPADSFDYPYNPVCFLAADRLLDECLAHVNSL